MRECRKGWGEGRGEKALLLPKQRSQQPWGSARQSSQDSGKKTSRLNLYQDTQQENLLKPIDRRRAYYSVNSLFRISWGGKAHLCPKPDEADLLALHFQ